MKVNKLADGATSETLAMGSANLSLECQTGREGEKRCAPKVVAGSSMSSISLTTIQTLSAPESGCPGGPRAYYSWQVEEWRRRYELPATAASQIDVTTAADTGPSFKLHAMVTGETFTCNPSEDGRQGVFEGTCKRGSDFSRTTAKFRFDSRSNLLNVTQYWNCGNS
jgi:hypothetical protein